MNNINENKLLLKRLFETQLSFYCL